MTKPTSLRVGSYPCGCRLPFHDARLVAVTGGPGAGKTTVLELAARSFCEHVRSSQRRRRSSSAEDSPGTRHKTHVREPTGFRSPTDIDIIAMRPPNDSGPLHHQTRDAVEECLIVTDLDPDLQVDPNRFDVISPGFLDVGPRL